MRRQGKYPYSANLNKWARNADINYCADCNGAKQGHFGFFQLSMLFEVGAIMLRLRIGPLVFLTPCLVLAGGCTNLPEYVRNGFKVGPNYASAAAPVADEWIDKRKDGEEP